MRRHCEYLYLIFNIEEKLSSCVKPIDWGGMRVVDVMIKDPICCAESCTAETVAHLLSKADCGVVPVLNQLS